MILGLSLLFAPEYGWQRIERANRSAIYILVVSLLPLMALSGFVEGYGLVHWGDRRSDYGGLVTLSQYAAWRHELVQAALALVLIFAGAKFVQWTASSFNFEPGYKPCFVLVSYSITPLFLVRFLDAIPSLSTWICWTIGALLIFIVLYQGIAFILKPSPTTAFGIYLVSGLTLVSFSAIAHLLAYSILREKIRLPF